MIDRKRIESIARKEGFENFKWVSGKDVLVRQWVRFKCMFGCTSYGKKGTCPPRVPSIAECRELFSEYEHILILHLRAKVDRPEDRKEWSRKKSLELLSLEKETFLAGYQKTLLLFMDEC